MGKIKHIKTEIDNIKFDSVTESLYYIYIRDNKDKLGIKEYKLQPEFILQEKHMLIDNKVIIPKNEKEFRSLQRKYPGCTIQPIKYIADFLITYNDGHQEVIDVKGVKTPDFKIKEKIFNFKYPQYRKLKCISLYKNNWYEWEKLQQLKKEEKKKNK